MSCGRSVGVPWSALHQQFVTHAGNHKQNKLVFQLVKPVTNGHRRVLTSDKRYREQGEIFGDPVVASAMLDRLLHHCHIVNIKGNSYRLREYPGLPLPQEQSALRRRYKRKGKEV